MVRDTLYTSVIFLIFAKAKWFSAVVQSDLALEGPGHDDWLLQYCKRVAAESCHSAQCQCVCSLVSSSITTPFSCSCCTWYEAVNQTGQRVAHTAPRLAWFILNSPTFMAHPRSTANFPAYEKQPYGNIQWKNKISLCPQNVKNKQTYKADLILMAWFYLIVFFFKLNIHSGPFILEVFNLGLLAETP